MRRQTSRSPATGSGSLEAVEVAHALVVGAPGAVDADQHLVGGEHLGSVDGGAPYDARLAVLAFLQLAAGAHDLRQADDRIVLGLAMDRCQHHVGRRFGEVAAALDRGQLERVAKHQDRLAEGEEVARQLRVDHRAFVDDDEPHAGGRAILVQDEGRRRAVDALARPVDERWIVDRAGAAAGAHHQRRLAGEGGEGGLAVRPFRDMAGERRLADAGVAEEAEHLRLAAA